MLKLNVKMLMSAVSALEEYRSPIEDEEGIKYLYDTVYAPVATGNSVGLCDINFSLFSLDDVGRFEDWYNAEIYRHGRTASYFAQKLRTLRPAAAGTNFI